MFKFKFEQAPFKLDTNRRPGGSAPSMGIFIEPETGERWLGKSEIGMSEEASKIIACKEKLANDIYSFYGIRTSRLRIVYLPLMIEDPTVKQLYRSLGRTHAWHILSRWLDRFEIYGYCPQFQNGTEFKLRVANRDLPERNLGKILAVAHWINDIDVCSPEGKNVGYQLQLNAQGKLNAFSCKIDPGNAFHDFHKAETPELEDKIQLATTGISVSLKVLPKQTRQEYLETLQSILRTSEERIRQWFQSEGLQCLESTTAQIERNDFITLRLLAERLLQRRNKLTKLYEKELKSLVIKPEVPLNNTIPDYLQRLYCQAELSYQTEVYEKEEFYIPLDVVSKSGSIDYVGLNEYINQNFSREQTQTILLLGNSGSGKSLATQLLVKQLWEAFLKKQSNLIPLRIELKQFTERTVGQCIINTLLDEYHYTVKDFRKLQTHHFIFILDGYDEIENQAKINIIQKHLATEKQYGKWSAKFVITCRDNYYHDITPLLFQGSPDKQLAVRYLSELKKEQQIQYLQKYKARYPEKKLPDFIKILKENPSLHELLSNPFLLRIFRDALSQWLINNPNKEISKLTRYTLFTAFLDFWFSNEALRLCLRQPELLPEDLPHQFLEFSLKLAMAMHEMKTDEISDTEGNKKLWENFFSHSNELVAQARIGCPLRRTGSNRYCFIHKSFQEYLTARRLIEALKTDVRELEWNKRSLLETPAVLEFLLDELRKDIEGNRQYLWICIEKAKRKTNFKIASANAATVMNNLDNAFTGLYGNLENAELEGANLAGAICDHASMKNANLRGANLSKTILRKADLSQADLREVIWGEHKRISHTYIVASLSVSKDCQYLALASSNFIEVWSQNGKECVAKFQANLKAAVTYVSLNADGSLLASSHTDNVICLWSVREKKEIARLQGNLNEVYNLKLNDNGKLIAAAIKKSILLWWPNDKKASQLSESEAYDPSRIEFPNNALSKLSYRDDKTTWLINVKSVETWRDHSAAVSSVVLTSDGLLISGSYDYSVIVRLSKNEEKCIHLQGHTEKVSAISVTSDSKMIASASWDTTIRLWSVVEKKEIACLNGHEGPVYGINFGVKDTVVASGGADKAVRVWLVAERKEIMCLEGHAKHINSVNFNPDGTLIVSGSSDNTVRLWSVKDQKEIACLKEHSSSVMCVKFSSDGQLIASGGYEGAVVLWSVKHQTVLSSLKAHRDWVSSVDFSPLDKYVVSGSGDGKVIVWSVEHKEPVIVGGGHEQGVNSICLNKNLMLSGGDNGEVLLTSMDFEWIKGDTDLITVVPSNQNTPEMRLWSVASLQEITYLQEDYFVNCLSISPDGNYIVAGGSQNYLKIWSVKDKKVVANFERKLIPKPLPKRNSTRNEDSEDEELDSDNSEVEYETVKEEENKIGDYSVTHTEGSIICACANNNVVKSWTILFKNEREAAYEFIARLKSYIFCVCFSPDGKLIAAGCNDNYVRVWSIIEKREIACFQGHKYRINGINFSTDSKFVISGGNDSTVRIWSLIDFGEISCTPSNQRAVQDVFFAPDKNVVVLEHGDNNVHFLPTRNNNEFLHYRRPKVLENSVVYDPTNNLVISGSLGSNTVRLWSVKNNGNDTALIGHKMSICSVSLSNDVKFIVSGSVDSSIMMWSLEKKEAIICFEGHRNAVNCVKFSPDDQLIVSGSQDKTVRLWSRVSKKEVACFQGHTKGVNSVEFSADGQTVFSGSEDESLRFWSVNNKNCIGGFNLKSIVNSVGVTNELIVAGCKDGSLRLFQHKDTKKMFRLEGHTKPVTTVSCSYDGKLIASGASDSTIRIWSTASFKCLQILNGHGEYVYCVSFNKLGSLVSCDSVSIFIWTLVKNNEWQITWRLTAYPTLVMEDTILENAILSEEDSHLLQKHGANTNNVQIYSRNRYSFWDLPSMSISQKDQISDPDLLPISSCSANLQQVSRTMEFSQLP